MVEFLTLGLRSVGQAHQVHRLPVDLILGTQCKVKFHNLKDRGHRLVIQSLSIRNFLHLALNLIEAEQYLLDVFQITVVLSSQALELFLKQVSLLCGLGQHKCQVLSKLVLCLR